MKSVTHIAGPLAVAAALTAASVLSTGCNASLSPYAAKVGNTTITPAQLNASLTGAYGNTSFRCLLENTASTGYRFHGAGTDTWDSQYVNFVLTNLIESAVVRSALSANHVVPTATARAIVTSELEQQFSSELSDSHCGGTGPSVLGELKSTLTPSFVDLRLGELSLAAKAQHVQLSDGGIAAWESTHRTENEEACLSGIFAKSASVAQHAYNLSKSGTPFATLLKRYSTPPSGVPSTGVLGCYTSSELTEIGASVASAVAQTATGSLSKPITDQGQTILLDVTSRPLQPVADAVSLIIGLGTSAYTSAIERVERAEGVTVDPAYGRWVPTTTAGDLGGKLVSPTAPAADFLVNENATRGSFVKAPSSALGSAATG